MLMFCMSYKVHSLLTIIAITTNIKSANHVAATLCIHTCRHGEDDLLTS